MLPESASDTTDVAFAWGMWFQVLKALTESELKEKDSSILEHLAIVKEILWRKYNAIYWEHFLGELDKQDYVAFKSHLFAPL